MLLLVSHLGEDQGPLWISHPIHNTTLQRGRLVEDFVSFSVTFHFRPGLVKSWEKNHETLESKRIFYFLMPAAITKGVLTTPRK